MNDNTRKSANNAIWEPTPNRKKSTNLHSYIESVNQNYGLSLQSYEQLHHWSVDNISDFWSSIWDYCQIKSSEKGDQAYQTGERFIDAKFFPDAKLNFAENLLQSRTKEDAIVFRCENGSKESLSGAELYLQCAKFAFFLKSVGVKPGDRVAAVLPNIPQTIVAMLAATSLACIWSSCSPEFGEQGVLDRFEQIEPTVLIVSDGYYFNGKRIDFLEKANSIIPKLTSTKSVVLIPFAGKSDLEDAVLWQDALNNDAEDLEFVQMPFNYPLFILFSSGTTGKPKCIVHSSGGTLLQHCKEHQLHCDIKPGDRAFYFTTCSWMMWNWLVTALASEATLMLYDGSPFYPDGNVLFDYAQDEKFTLFGTSAKYIDALKKTGLTPHKTHKLDSIRLITSTGSPLLPDSYDFVYAEIKPDVSLASISGGTDIISCFVLGSPYSSVYRGEIQARGLGMAVEVYNEEGKPVIGEKGELVCVKPFPSQPISFWNDKDDKKYLSAYFDRFENIWSHGDYAEITERGSMIIYGRSDAVLNPGGVRIGTAEIYRQVEKLDEVLESIAIGQDIGGDVRVVLFVVLREGLELTDDLRDRIKQQIRTGASPRHVPAVTVQVPEIPRTTSGKIVELAVRDIVHGREVKNQNALANPDALRYFAGLDELELVLREHPKARDLPV